jgi:xylulokinase
MPSENLMGFDIGSSSIKAVLLDAATGNIIASASSPEKELSIIAKQVGWAEQDPRTWWEHMVIATKKLKQAHETDLLAVAAIGISYQMHGLVMVNTHQNVLAPSIIWCDSRAVTIGDQAFIEIGQEKCLDRLLNSPGNFTASKLKWVKEHQPDIFAKVDKIMLPGDYAAMRLTGKIHTTLSGLSEMMLWDFSLQNLADFLLEYYGIPKNLIPEIIPTFGNQGHLTPDAAKALGLTPGIPVTYRAGDQPNNALSLNVLEPGQIAATAGTSGVVYGIGSRKNYDPESRVNTFAHVNYTPNDPRYGILLCINGTGSLNGWIRNHLFSVYQEIEYEELNRQAMKASIGSNGLMILPFGNGAERSLGNKNLFASFHGLDFSRHNHTHLLRASQEGIVFALNYGMGIMKSMGIDIQTIRAGKTNLFLSPLFAQTLANIAHVNVQLFDTNGAAGAARGAGIGAGIYKNADEAFAGLKCVRTYQPIDKEITATTNAYNRWLDWLNQNLTIGKGADR